MELKNKNSHTVKIKKDNINSPLHPGGAGVYL